MDIQEIVEIKKGKLLTEGFLMGEKLVINLERETVIEKLKELENRVKILETK